jgi:hypothetical protein
VQLLQKYLGQNRNQSGNQESELFFAFDVLLVIAFDTLCPFHLGFLVDLSLFLLINRILCLSLINKNCDSFYSCEKLFEQNKPNMLVSGRSTGYFRVHIGKHVV